MGQHAVFAVDGGGTVGGGTMQVHRTGGSLIGGQAAGQQAAVIPASTSPLPPRERPGLPVGFTRTRPSGAATTVRAPLSTTTAFHACAYRRAVPSRSALICDAARPVSRAISPG